MSANDFPFKPMKLEDVRSTLCAHPGSDGAPEQRQQMLGLARAASRRGDLTPLEPTLCCEILWSSNPEILEVKSGGWTRDGRCAVCEKDLTGPKS